ncbi:MAG: hypothetical protein AAF485_24240 [Chloroflexota bacterium]
MSKYQLGTALIAGHETVILHTNDTYFELQTVLPDAPGSLMAILEEWGTWQSKLSTVVTATNQKQLSVMTATDIEWLPPLMYPRKLICIGINYRDHIKEMGLPSLPQIPYSFLKPPTTTLVGKLTTMVTIFVGLY